MSARAYGAAAMGAYLAKKPRLRILGIDYLHLQMGDGSDLYVTEHGLPIVSQLLPQNYWTDEAWFGSHHIRLPGTSMAYKITTKDVDGYSRDIVLKWNRMGQDIPGKTQAGDTTARFNSPFEEFSLVTEMRDSFNANPSATTIHTPLAIYVPRQYVEMDQLGRRRDWIEVMQELHKEVALDANRQYAVIYDWIRGVDAAHAFKNGVINEFDVRSLLDRANEEMEERGFHVVDHKAQHLIVRPLPNGKLATDEKGEVKVALVDFELLERTPQREAAIRKTKRQDYLVKQAHRFETRAEFPPELSRINIMGVDYVFGKVESTGGALWVVGADPMLFDYFLPEKWRTTPRKRLSFMSQVYDTITKDSIHLVWRLSKVGLSPDVDPFLANEREILAYGHNSPFEEFSFALELSAKKIATTYPRAIYMSGHQLKAAENITDDSRYISHGSLVTEDGHPVLGKHHEYITLWGYWNGPDEMLATRDDQHYSGIDALRAYRQGLITEEIYLFTIQKSRERLTKAGFEDLNLRGNHLLLSLDAAGRLIRDDEGVPATRLCTFELVRRIQTKETDKERAGQDLQD